MPRYFNTAGPCRPAEHYMLAPERRLPAVSPLVERGQCFVVHAPRQSGKTTLFRTLAESLTAGGAFTALLTTCETGQVVDEDLEGTMTAVLEILRQKAGESLPAELQGSRTRPGHQRADPPLRRPGPLGAAVSAAGRPLPG